MDQARFDSLKARWKVDTGFLSSLTQILDHAAYREIVCAGWAAVPFILRDLEKGPDHWGTALQEITGVETPIRPEDAGKLGVIAEAWVRWGRRRGIVF